MEQYVRVIPRDFFNESKLLKCMGKLSLSVLDCTLPKGITVIINDTGDPFDIRLSDDGSLYVENVETFVNDRVSRFFTRYNSKRNFPFYCIHPDSLEEIEVFTETGEFSDDFVSAWRE